MSETISGRWSRFLLNSLLVGSAGHAAYHIEFSAHPCACAACFVGIGVGILGLLRVLFGSGKPDECRILRDISHDVLELAPLPLVNIELYIKSQGLGMLALSHAIFVLPLCCDFMCILLQERQHCNIIDTLRDLSVLGNIVSLVFLAYMTQNTIYARMAFSMWMLEYSALLGNGIEEGCGEDMQIFGYVCFYRLLCKALLETLDAGCPHP